MVEVLMEFTVTDYETWKAAFDERAPTRDEHGCRGYRLFRRSDVNEGVVVLFDWDSIQGAQSYVRAVDLPARLQETGVDGEVRLAFLDEVESRSGDE
jgi:quinol monooxygenase YgiN